MRVVLDTYTIISTLLFSGVASRLVSFWQSGHITVLISRAILKEYLRTLAYPKFRLTEQEIKQLVEEQLLAYVETIRKTVRLTVIETDPEDKQFLECAVSRKAEYLITGDGHLLDLGSYQQVTILSVGEFLKRLDSSA